MVNFTTINFSNSTGQGAIAIEAKKDNKQLKALLRK